jgi:hypothetical protein
MVNNIPGLNIMNRVVVTIRSVFVKTRPIDLATRVYTRKKTRAWNMTDIWSVFPLANLILSPAVVTRTPGLRAKKREAGVTTFGEVISGSIINI